MKTFNFHFFSVFLTSISILIHNSAYAGDNGFINFAECEDCGEIFCKELDLHECPDYENSDED